MANCDVLVLGAGPAGLTAGLYSARAGAKTIIAENMVPGGQVNLTPDIMNIPGFMEINGAEFGEKLLAQAENAGCEILYDELESIDIANNTATFMGETVTYKNLIIATGASPRKLGVDNEEYYIGNGIHFCGLCDGQFYNGKDIVIVGGGNHAVEEILYLYPIAKSITVVNNLAGFTAHKVTIDQIPTDVKVYHNSTVAKITGDKKISAITLNDGTEIQTNGIFVCIGRKPNNEPFSDTIDMNKHGYINVNHEMRTNIPNIFACGDIINKSVYQVVTACSDGAIAATYATKK